MTGLYKPQVTYLTTPLEKKDTRETVDEIKDYPFYSNPLRGVRDEIYKSLGYKMKISEKDGKTLEAAYYPILRKGKLVGWKKRDFTKPKKNCFSIIGEADVSCDLIGAWKLKPGKRLTIVEGEEDLAACYQAIKDQIDKKPDWKGKIHPNVVSVVGGAPFAAENVSHNIEVVNEYQQVVTAFDNDRTTPKEYEKGARKGYEATCETQLLVGFDKCKYAPFKLKDPSEYLQAGKQSELAEILAFGLSDFTPITIETGDEMSLEELLTPNERGAMLSCLPNTFEILRGIRFYEGTLVLAPPKSGKTSLCKQISYDLILDCLEKIKSTGDNRDKVGHIYLEETTKKTRQSFLALHTHVSLPKLRELGEKLLPKAKAAKAYEELYASGVNVFLNTKEGSLKPDSVVKHLRYMYAKGCRYIVLDHLSMVISGSAANNERKEIDNLLTEIAAFCESHPVHVFIVSHIKRGDFQPPKDEDGNIIYPYWQRVDHTDARGSGAFEQLMWNCICIEPERIDAADNIGRIRTKVTFCREWGTKGIGDYLRWDEKAGRLLLTEGD